MIFCSTFIHSCLLFHTHMPTHTCIACMCLYAWRHTRNIEMWYWGTRFSGEILVVGGWLDWMILEAFSNLGDFMMYFFQKFRERWTPRMASLPMQLTWVFFKRGHRQRFYIYITLQQLHRDKDCMPNRWENIKAEIKSVILWGRWIRNNYSWFLKMNEVEEVPKTLFKQSKGSMFPHSVTTIISGLWKPGIQMGLNEF